MITIHAPCDWINSNQRRHRMQVAKLTAEWRKAGLKAALQHEPVPTPTRIIATIHKTRGGRYDPNNLYPTIKACLDGIVDAGIIPDDDHKHVIGPDMRHGDKTTEAHVVFTFETTQLQLV